MSNVITDSSNFQAIAQAIRARTGSDEGLTPAVMAAAVEAIPAGGSFICLPGQVTFAQIQEAFAQGKVCFLNYSDILIPLLSISQDTNATFGITMESGGIFISAMLTIDAGDQWSSDVKETPTGEPLFTTFTEDLSSQDPGYGRLSEGSAQINQALYQGRRVEVLFGGLRLGYAGVSGGDGRQTFSASYMDPEDGRVHFTTVRILNDGAEPACGHVYTGSIGL